MSVKNRNTLKSEFANGTMATEEKFANMIDSPYNRAEDSLLLGPAGITGTYGLKGPTGGGYNGVLGPIGSTHYNGLLGPTGSTHYTGFFLSKLAAAPTGPNAPGTIGEIFIMTGTTAYTYMHTGISWIRIVGATAW
jgi:hypothetical protein